MKKYERLVEAYSKLKEVLKEYDDVINLKFRSQYDLMDAHIKTREIVELYNFHRVSVYHISLNTKRIQLEPYIYYKKWDKLSRIPWPDGGIPEHGEELLVLSFPKNSDIFSVGIPVPDVFDEFFNELKSYNPDYSDSINKTLYFKVECCRRIYDDFPGIFRKYEEKAVIIMREEKIRKLEEELKRFKSKDI